jgi:hypothetical protein
MGDKTMSSVSISWRDWLTIIFASYVIFECLTAVTDMCKGWKNFCQKLKYSMGFATSASLIYYAFMPLNQEFQYLIFGMQSTLAIFVWPRMVYRLNAFLKDMEEWI